MSFFPVLVDALKSVSSPDQSLSNFERFIWASLSRQDLYTFFRKAKTALDMLLRLFSTSQALSQTLIRNPEYYDWLMDPLILKTTWPKQIFNGEIDSIMDVLQKWHARVNALRRFKRRQYLRIGVRDIEGWAPLEETVRDISFLAQVCLEWAYDLSYRELKCKFGEPRSEYDPNQAAEFAIIGMGKLGGLELNYSSDIDLIFVYSQEGSTTGAVAGPIENHLFFTRLAQEILKVLGERTREGYLYRVDMRLRPEGESGPLVRSLDSFESYYASWGQSWERLALVKARFVAGDEKTGNDFIERITPFVYRKYEDTRILDEVRIIKARIDVEVQKRGEEERDVKLGFGGIREIEFSLQVLQLLYGGRTLSLRQTSSLDAIHQLQKAGLLEKDIALRLKESYCFLRRLEHFLQLEEERQTHVLPEELEKLTTLASRLGYSTSDQFLSSYEEHKKFVHHFFETIFLGAVSLENSFVSFFQTGFLNESQKVFLGTVGFRNEEEAIRHLLKLVRGPDEINIADRVLSQGAQMVSLLVGCLKRAFDPDQALVGFGRFVSAYKARGVLFEIFNDAPQMMELLVMIFGMSPLLTNILIKEPGFLDTISASPMGLPVLNDEASGEEGKASLEGLDFESVLLSLRRYKNLNFLRIGVRDILSLSPCMEIVQDLSKLAEIVLKSVLRISKAYFEEKYRFAPPPFVVIGLGKLGGQELGYASDLDVMFVSSQDISGGQHSNILGSIVMDALSRNMADGFLYKVDPRLRPDGVKGPLVQSLETCRDYYGGSHSLWERMALSRARIIAGDEGVGEELKSILAVFIFGKSVSFDDVEELKDLREMIYRERCSDLPRGFEIKSGLGGLLDIEFTAQFLLIKHKVRSPASSHANTLELLRDLSDAGFLSKEDQGLLVRAYLFYRETENALRLVKDRATDFIPREPQWAIRLQKKMKLEQDPEHFFTKLEHFSKVVRHLYHKYITL